MAPDFTLFFPLNGQMWVILKLLAELFTSTGRDFDTPIKLKGEEYFG